MLVALRKVRYCSANPRCLPSSSSRLMPRGSSRMRWLAGTISANRPDIANCQVLSTRYRWTNVVENRREHARNLLADDLLRQLFQAPEN